MNLTGAPATNLWSYARTRLVRAERVCVMSNEVTRIVVAADVAARSRPSGHTVPRVRTPGRTERARPDRSLIVLCVLSVMALAGVGVAGYYSYAAGRAAGYHLVCQTVGVGRFAQSDCHWEQ